MKSQGIVNHQPSHTGLAGHGKILAWWNDDSPGTSYLDSIATILSTATKARSGAQKFHHFHTKLIFWMAFFKAAEGMENSFAGLTATTTKCRPRRGTERCQTLLAADMIQQSRLRLPRRWGRDNAIHKYKYGPNRTNVNEANHRIYYIMSRLIRIPTGQFLVTNISRVQDIQYMYVPCTLLNKWPLETRKSRWGGSFIHFDSKYKLQQTCSEVK